MAGIERRRALSIESSSWMVMTITIGGLAAAAAGLFNTRRQVRNSIEQRQAQISPIPEAGPEIAPAQETNVFGQRPIEGLPGGDPTLGFYDYLLSTKEPSVSED